MCRSKSDSAADPVYSVNIGSTGYRRCNRPNITGIYTDGAADIVSAYDLTVTLNKSRYRCDPISLILGGICITDGSADIVGSVAVIGSSLNQTGDGRAYTAHVIAGEADGTADISLCNRFCRSVGISRISLAACNYSTDNSGLNRINIRNVISDTAADISLTGYLSLRRYRSQLDITVIRCILSDYACDITTVSAYY